MGEKRSPCPGLWKTPVIRHDGEVMACCADVDGEILIGNVKNDTFQALWEGKKMTQYRLWHIEGAFHKIPKCLNCGGINWIQMDREEIRNYLEEIGQPSLYGIYLARLGLSDGDA